MSVRAVLGGGTVDALQLLFCPQGGGPGSLPGAQLLPQVLTRRLELLRLLLLAASARLCPPLFRLGGRDAADGEQLGCPGGAVADGRLGREALDGGGMGEQGPGREPILVQVPARNLE